MHGSISLPTDTSPDPSQRVRRNPFDFAVIFFGLVAVMLVLVLVSWQFWHANRIFTGVRIAGVPVGNMTRLEAINHLNRKLQPYPLPPVSLTYEGTQLPLTQLSISTAQTSRDANHDVATTVDFISAVNRAYLIGRDESIPKQLQDQLLALLIGINVQPQLSFNRAQVRHVVALAAEQLHQPARPPREVAGVQVAGQDGITVDVESTLVLLLEEMRTNANGTNALTSPFVVHRIPAETLAQTLPAEGAESSTSAETPSENALFHIGSKTPSLPPVLLQNDSGNDLAIDAATVETILFSKTPLVLDREKLAGLLAQWAIQLRVEPRDARLQFNPATGTVNILQTSMAGRAMDVEATLQAVESAFAAAASSAEPSESEPSTPLTRDIIQAPLVMKTIAPAVDMNQIPQLGIRELVASGTTYFAGSSAARIRNIEVAASKFEGVVIPPGGLFSFNELVEDVSSANGFEDSLIIWGDQTAVGVGGGVCQVSTTVFRAAYEAGLPIVERYNHGYVVSWYGEPGLDATIYTPSVDFKFRNDTQAHLLISPFVDSANGTITFNLYGTKPNRQVIINDPVVTEIEQPEPAIYKVDEELALGEQEQVEWEKEGKTVEVTRTIIEDSETRTDTITSKYQPWQAVFLVGPGTLAEPTPAPPSSE